jgi:phosphoglycerate dehydrogenase-like enzyme
MKILISDKASPKAAEVLRNAGHEVDEKFGVSAEQLLEIIADYDGLIVRSATKVTREVFSQAKNLKVVGRAGTGVDNIDLDAAAEKNVVVMNTPGANTNAVAELTIGHMFALARDLYDTSKSLKEERWDKKKFSGVELMTKTLGVLGYGRIGRSVALKCKCLGWKSFVMILTLGAILSISLASVCLPKWTNCCPPPIIYPFMYQKSRKRQI